ncbi:MAG TPA: hypothetical protein VJ715_18000 [Pyrinomonadaceae bacterium]|nr:hypothetical protein [Pyrinomonadaceae bacterium]
MIRGRTRGKGRSRRAGALAMCAALLLSSLAFAQRPAASSSHGRTYPKEIRGYKVELAEVELKKQSAKEEARLDADEAQVSLIKLGQPKVTSISPFGIHLEVPVTVAAVKQGGRVDFLTFEDMTVNGTPVTVSEYHHSFELPNDRPVTLPDPIALHISTPRVLFGALGEWSKPQDIWPVTGRVYVFGRFKKFLFKFKRVVPVELALSFHNPLRNKTPEGIKQ